MKENKILKIFSYIIIPILVFIIFVSAGYEAVKEDIKNEHEYYSEYFKTDQFLNEYMEVLAENVKEMIYHNKSYKEVMDGDTRIYYNESTYPQYNREYKIKDFYFLICYNDIVFTNIELTSSTNTVESLHNYINDKDGKKTTILNGQIESDSEIIQTKAIRYFDEFNNSYYKSSENTIINNNEEITDSNNTIKLTLNQEETIEDLKIYATHEEKLEVNENASNYLKNIVVYLEPYDNQMIILIPICTIILLIILIYLVISIGHDKESKEIELNDFDKIPIEIVLFIGLMIFVIPIALIEICSNYVDTNLNFAISLSITAYIISYIICAVTAVTIIKRIKAKCLIKDSITGKILGYVRKVIIRLRNAYSKLLENTRLSFKMILYVVIYIAGMFVIKGIFGGLGIFIDTIISIYILYKIYEKINEYKKIEYHMKKMYEGDHSKKLESQDFSKEFQDIIKYINDLSKGFENAIQEGIKSEKMKTELITNVSHDIKTPLTSIINYVDLLKKENIQDEKVKEYIEILDGKSQRLKKLIEDLVEASKASSGNVKLNNEKIEVCELIKQTTGEFQEKFKEKNLDINLKMPESEVFINADSRYMYRIIENLFSNISKYALESSRVYIDVYKNENKVIINIKNISKEKLNITAEELMQRFVRGDKSRSTEGSGLGISISKSLTELQNGKFDMKVDGDLFKVELEFETI